MSGRPKVKFIVGQGGKGRTLAGFDHYSAMVAYYSATTANSAYAGIGDAIYNSIKDAEDDGIVNTCSEATAATSIQTVTTAGTNGDTVDIYFPHWDGSTIYLGTYLKVTGDNTVTLVATGIVAAINALTYITGFSATVGSTGAYTITAPKNFGTYPNTKSVTNTLSSGATLAITNAAFASGTVSPLALIHYQIKEFFRGNPGAVLYFSLKLDTSTNSASVFEAQLQTDGLSVANAFQGNARQILFYNPFRASTTASLTSLKALRTTLFSQYAPAVMLYYGKLSVAASALSNIRTLSDDGVGQVIGTSGSGKGYELSLTQQINIGSAGLCLGVLSACSVSGSIGEVQAHNLSDGVECEIASLFDGTNFTSISDSLADQLHDYGYIFLVKYRGASGTFFNAGNVAVAPSSDFAYLEDCRTIDKAIRNVYVSVLPLLNSKVLLNDNGTISEASAAIFKEKCDVALDGMVRDQDLSAFTTTVDRQANITSTSIVPINLKLLAVSIGREIDITIGFVSKV